METLGFVIAQRFGSEADKEFLSFRQSQIKTQIIKRILVDGEGTVIPFSYAVVDSLLLIANT